VTQAILFEGLPDRPIDGSYIDARTLNGFSVRLPHANGESDVLAADDNSALHYRGTTYMCCCCCCCCCCGGCGCCCWLLLLLLRLLAAATHHDLEQALKEAGRQRDPRIVVVVHHESEHDRHESLVHEHWCDCCVTIYHDTSVLEVRHTEVVRRREDFLGVWRCCEVVEGISPCVSLFTFGALASSPSLPSDESRLALRGSCRGAQSPAAFGCTSLPPLWTVL
jgi:hypothetical protein